jgi:hypothetical protein
VFRKRKRGKGAEWETVCFCERRLSVSLLSLLLVTVLPLPLVLTLERPCFDSDIRAAERVGKHLNHQDTPATRPHSSQTATKPSSKQLKQEQRAAAQEVGTLVSFVRAPTLCVLPHRSLMHSALFFFWVPAGCQHGLDGSVAGQRD